MGTGLCRGGYRLAVKILRRFRVRASSFRRFQVGMFAALIFGAGAAPSAPLVAQGPPDAADREAALRVLERASERYQEIGAFCGAFEQEMSVPLLRQVTRSHGTLCQAGADRFLMDFEDPEGDIVVADGTHVWVYFPSTDPGQVFRSGLSASDGRFDFHREFLEDPGEKYEPVHRGREEIEGRWTQAIHLTPIAPSPYRGAQVWIDTETSLIRKVEIEEDNESIRTVRLLNVEIDPDLADDLFEFTPPPGVQVITR